MTQRSSSTSSIHPSIHPSIHLESIFFPSELKRGRQSDLGKKEVVIIILYDFTIHLVTRAWILGRERERERAKFVLLDFVRVWRRRSQEEVHRWFGGGHCIALTRPLGNIYHENYSDVSAIRIPRTSSLLPHTHTHTHILTWLIYIEFETVETNGIFGPASSLPRNSIYVPFFKVPRQAGVREVRG